MKEADLELLDGFLDGELSPSEVAALRRRLATEPALAVTLRGVQAERSARSALFKTIEPTPGEVERFIEDMNTLIGHQERRIVRRPWIRRAGALAACVIIGFSMGYSLRWGIGEPGALQQTNAMSVGPVYQVTIRDETGVVVATQRFESLEEARRFSEDLARWQEHQEALLSAQATVRSAQF